MREIHVRILRQIPYIRCFPYRNLLNVPMARYTKHWGKHKSGEREESVEQDHTLMT